MMRVGDSFELNWNLEIDVFERGKRRPIHSNRRKNIFVNTGRQFIFETITASSFSGASFVRHQDAVVRYIGFGIGGARQTAPNASASPYSDLYAYGGYEYTPGEPHNTQTDDDVTVSKIERPVMVTNAPLWMREVSTPGTFPTATRVKYIATFSTTDINFGSYTSVPVSEIGLYKSTADSALPNGAAGSYPGTGGHMIAYDNFNPFQKTGYFSIEVRWELRLG